MGECSTSSRGTARRLRVRLTSYWPRRGASRATATCETRRRTLRGSARPESSGARATDGADGRHRGLGPGLAGVAGVAFERWLLGLAGDLDDGHAGVGLHRDLPLVLAVVHEGGEAVLPVDVARRDDAGDEDLARGLAPSPAH